MTMFILGQRFLILTLQTARRLRRSPWEITGYPMQTPRSGEFKYLRTALMVSRSELRTAPETDGNDPLTAPWVPGGAPVSSNLTLWTLAAAILNPSLSIPQATTKQSHIHRERHS